MAQQEPRRAVRLIFEYDGAGVRLVSEQTVEMVVPDGNAADLTRSYAPGYYVDTRDAANATLNRVRAEGAFAASTEVFPEDPTQSITRVDLTAPRGAFTVVLPAPDEADHITLLRMPPPGFRGAGRAERTLAPEPTVEIATFPLTRR